MLKKDIRERAQKSLLDLVEKERNEAKLMKGAHIKSFA